jgi:hypothetical protein
MQLAYFVVLCMIGVLRQASAGTPQSSTAQGHEVQVEIQYCEAKAEKPPLEKLYFHVWVHNFSRESRWVLLPLALYSAARGAARNAGIWHIDLLSDELGKIKLLRFDGTVRALPDTPNDGGGFQAVLLTAGSELRVPIAVDYWGRPGSLLPIRAVVARQLVVRGKPIGSYFRTPLANESATRAEHLAVVDSWQTSNHAEVPIAIKTIGDITIPDALATRCRPKSR